MKAKIFGLTIGAAAIVLVLSGGIQSANAQQEAPPDAQVNSEPADALPPDIQANAALTEVINLAQADVSENVIENYIGNVQSAFNLTASDIIYLKDIGIPDSIVLAMQERDKQLGEASPQIAAPAPPPATVVVDDGFYDSLAPYGNWIVIEGYGRCWRPAVVVYDSSWQPYCDGGHWVWTDCGWYWYSDYSWGWAPFHYGRWFRDAHYGWCWYPDTVWGPSWVCWRYSDDYCGWAPLPPHCEYREGVGLFFNGSRVSVGFDFGLSIGAFTFVATRDFCDPHPWQHRVDRTHVTQIYNHTTIINNFGGNNTTIINNGIPRDHIEAVTHTPIRQVTIHESGTPVRRGERLEPGGNTLVINRPNFEHNASQNANDNRPHTIPSPTTGAPMQVPPPNQNRNNNFPQRNTPPVQNRNSPNQNSYPAVTQPQNQFTAPNHSGNTPPQTQTRNYPSVGAPANQSVPNRTPNNSQQEWRTMSPRMSEQQPTPPPVQREEPRNYNAQPEPRVENSQPQERTYQPQPSQPAPQQSAPSQQPDRDKDKNGH